MGGEPEVGIFEFDGAPVEAWIKECYAQALSRASEDDRAMAAQMLKYWLQGRRE